MNRPKAWSKQKKEWKDIDQKRENVIKLRIQLSELRKVRDDSSKTSSLLTKFKDDPKFREYLELTTGKTFGIEKKAKPTEENNEAEDNADKEEQEIDAAKQSQTKLADKEGVSDALVSV